MSEETTAAAGPTTGPGAAHAAPEKRVTWAELFFDLVFVVAVTTLSTLLRRDHSWAGLLRCLIVFVPIYWLWVGTSIQANLTDTARPALQLRIFAVALAGVFRPPVSFLTKYYSKVRYCTIVDPGNWTAKGA